MANSKPNRGSFKPGQVANPHGRPRTGLALAEIIRAQLEGPGVMAQLTQRMIDVALGRSVCIDADWLRECAAARARGEPPPPQPTSGEMMQPSVAEMQRAWDMLCKYGGVPTEIAATVTQAGDAGSPTFDPSRLSPAERDLFDAVLRKAHGLDAPDEDGALEVEPADPRALPAPR
jgi:hypothetical protein